MRWRTALTADEQQAMADLLVEPGEECCLEAYRRGRLDAGDEDYRDE